MLAELLKRKRFWFALAVLAAAGTALWFQRDDIAAAVEHLSWADIQEAVRASGSWAPVLCIILLALFTLLFLPTTAIVVVVALLYGTVQGFLICWSGFILGMSCAFGLARYFLHGWLERRIGDTAVYKKIERGIQRDGWKIILFSRMLPVTPYPFLNYAYGLTSVRFSTFIIASGIGVIPNLLAFLWTTHAAGQLATGKTDWRVFLILGAGALLFALLAFLPRLLRPNMTEEVEEEQP